MHRAACFALLVAFGAAAQASDSPITLGSAIFKGQSAPVHDRALLFNATSCEACHRDGAGGAGPKGDGPVPVALVIQLETPPGPDGAGGDGDPVYGRVLNTAAAGGVQPEGVATVRYREIEGQYYPEGLRWRMRVPRYELTGLSRGPLAAKTVIKPRLAPSLYGATLLEAIPESAIADVGTGPKMSRGGGEPAWRWYRGTRVVGRFGWQGDSVSVRDQATKAFARELGLTSHDQPYDDCTSAETDCRQARGGSPAISDESLSAVEAYLATFQLPEPRVRSEAYSSRLAVFVELGCAACHRPELPVELPKPADQARAQGVIAPYSDLRLHALGAEMDDRTAAGERVPSKWRTAPLWGLTHRVSAQGSGTLLHDGRARSVEEAILWHGGEAAEARRRFLGLMASTRESLLRWIEAL